MGSSGPSVPKNAGGGVVIVSPSLLGRFGSTCVAREIVGCRAVVVELSGRGLHPLALCCVHVLPEWGQVAECNFLERVRVSTPTVGEACLILGGDVNFPGVGEGRMDVRTRRVTMFDDNISS